MPTPEWRAKHGREKLSDEARERLNAKRRAWLATDEGRAYEREQKRRRRAALRERISGPNDLGIVRGTLRVLGGCSHGLCGDEEQHPACPSEICQERFAALAALTRIEAGVVSKEKNG